MSESFFHKGISRFQAEMSLTKAKEDGSFLVRDSESLSGAYVLCVLHQAKVHQYRILPGQDGKLHVQTETGNFQRGYNDLTELIRDYIKKGGQNGLISALIHPVPPEGSQEELYATDEDDEDDEDFEQPPPPTSPPSSAEQKSRKETVDFLKNFSQLDLTGLDSQFTAALKDYVENGHKKDAVSINVGDSELHEFTKLLEITTAGLKRELDVFMHKMDIMNEFLRIGTRKTYSMDTKRLKGPGLPTLMEQLTRVRTEILHVQTKAQEAINLASVPSEYEYLEDQSDPTYKESHMVSGPFLSSTYRPCIPHSIFEVRKMKHGKPCKITLNVDLQNGLYGLIKPTGRENLEQKTVSHKTILHLIKSTKDQSMLDLILDGRKKHTYIFNDPHQRENFCFQIRQMKNMHSTETEVTQISVFVGSWNMGDTPPNQSLSTWLKCNGGGRSRDRVLAVIPHDLYVIGTQESSMTEKDWVNTLKAGLKACVLVDMELVEVCTLWGIRLAVLVKPEYKNYISRIQRASVRTGIANALGNKGAVAISFYFNGTSFCFVNSHLTSGDERLNRRNQNYRDIIKGLTMSMGQKHLSNFDITNQFHHMFWLGDLNYRVDEDIQVLLNKIQEKDLPYLLQRDQLKMAQNIKTAFCGFQEAEITFPPTYRLERNTVGYKYAWKKIKRTGVRINSPSWCDRVLWRSYPGVFIENVAYGCSKAILSSDHRPVFSSFNVGISSEFINSRGSLAEMSPVKIIFHSIEAQVKTCCKQYFQLVFHSTCLQEVYHSQQNNTFKENRIGFYTVPVWQATNIPEMKPLFGDLDFLEEQHILVSVVSKDDPSDSYGECVVSLKDMFTSDPKVFECALLHQGEETGKLMGMMHVTSKLVRSSSKRSSPYSLIAYDTDYHDPAIFVADHPKEELRIVPNRSVGSVQQKTGNPRIRQPVRQVNSMCPSASDPERQLVYDVLEEHQLLPKVDTRAPQPLPGLTLQAGPVPTPRKNPPVMGQMGLLQGSQRNLSRQGPGMSPDCPPPPVPPKKSTARGECAPSYDTLKRPMTLEEWLAQLNLSCYEHNFIENGWDSLLFLNELTVEDLNGMGVTVLDHQDRILASVKELNKV